MAWPTKRKQHPHYYQDTQISTHRVAEVFEEAQRSEIGVCHKGFLSCCRSIIHIDYYRAGYLWYFEESIGGLLAFGLK